MDAAHTERPPTAARKGPGALPLHIGIAGPVATEDIARLLWRSKAPLPAGYAGAPFLAILIEELLARGHRVSVFTLTTDLTMRADSVVMAEGARLKVYYCPMRPRAWQPNGYLPGRIVDLYRLERQTLVRMMRQAAPDVIHAHWAYEFAWAAQSARIPVLITCHDSPFAVARFYKGFILGGYRWLRALMAWYVLRRARQVSTVSPYMQEQLRPLCRVPVELVPNPISPGTLGALRSDTPRSMRVLMVCNGWGAIKNPQPALQGLAKLAERMPEVELVLLGQAFGPGEQASSWWARHQLEGRVQFIGAVPYCEVINWMCCSDVLLHPSLEESFGMVLAEAMATGLAVVAGRNSGAVPWVLAGCGRLVDVTSPEDICEALYDLLNNQGSRQSLAAAAKESVAGRFSSAAVAKQYLTLYKQTLADAAKLAY